MLVKITPDLLVIDKNESREIHQLKVSSEVETKEKSAVSQEPHLPLKCARAGGLHVRNVAQRRGAIRQTAVHC